MTIATLTSKGQITIPAASQPVQTLKGLIAKPEKAVAIEKMNAVIVARGASARR